MKEFIFWATGSSGCLPSQLCQTNQTWKGEPFKILVEKGYWKVFGAKLLPIVNVIFCSIPKNDANFCYLDHLTFGASAPRCKLAKRGSDDSVPAASPMIRSAKGWRRGRRKFCFLLEFLLNYEEVNLVILRIRSLFPYQGLILPC